MANDLPVVFLVIYNLGHMYQVSLVIFQVCTKSIFWPWPRPKSTCSDVNMANDLMLAVNPQLFVKIVELISASHIEYRPYRLYVIFWYRWRCV